MFGIETFEVLLFLRQAGLAIAGAAAFWGSIFLIYAKKFPQNSDGKLWQGVARKLPFIFFPALLLYGAAWTALAITQCVFCLNAHEGISIAATHDALSVAMQAQYGVFITLMIVGSAGFAAYLAKRGFFYKQLTRFYAVAFIIISAILLYPWTPVESFREFLSIALHGWHSILTLGSVIMVDFLFSALKSNLRPCLVRIFPMVSRGIWLGLGLDFLSSGLVFREEFFVTEKFLFTQTLIAVIIINGVILSGPIARHLMPLLLRPEGRRLSPRFAKLFATSGSVSLASWISITALDGFRALTLSYFELLAFYLAFVALLFYSHEILEKFAEKGRGY